MPFGGCHPIFLSEPGGRSSWLRGPGWGPQPTASRAPEPGPRAGLHHLPQALGAGLVLVPLTPQEEASSGGAANRSGRVVGATPGYQAWGQGRGRRQPGLRGKPGPCLGRKAFHAGTVPGGLGAGTQPEGPEVRGQETLRAPGTPRSAAGGSDVELRPCSLLAEPGPQVGCLCPLLGLCRRVLGRPTVALAPKSRLGLPARRELCASPAVAGLRGWGPGGGWAVPPEDFPQAPPPSTAGRHPSSPSPWVTGWLGTGRTLEPIASTLRSPRLTFLWLLRPLEMDCVQEAMRYS